MDFEMLCDINRFSDCHLIEPESDAEHTIRMQLKALEIINQLYLNKCEITIDINKLIFNILIHDCDEIGSGDLPRPFKYHDEMILKEIRRVNKERMAKLGLSDELYDLITSDLKTTENDEGLILKYLDIESVVDKLIREYRLQGSNQILNRIHEVKEYIDEFYVNYIELFRDENIRNIIDKRIKTREKRLERIIKDGYDSTE